MSSNQEEQASERRAACGRRAPCGQEEHPGTGRSIGSVPCDEYHRLGCPKYIRFSAGSDAPHKRYFFQRFGAASFATASLPPTRGAAQPRGNRYFSCISVGQKLKPQVERLGECNRACEPA